MFEYEEDKIESEENLAKEIGRLWRQYKNEEIYADELLDRVQAVLNAREE